MLVLTTLNTHAMFHLSTDRIYLTRYSCDKNPICIFGISFSLFHCKIFCGNASLLCVYLLNNSCTKVIVSVTFKRIYVKHNSNELIARTLKRYIYLQQDVSFGEFLDEKDEEGFSFYVIL